MPLIIHFCYYILSNFINPSLYPQTPRIDGGTFQAKVAYADFPGRVYIQKVAEYERLEDLLEALAEEYGEAAKTGSLPRLGVEPKIGELVKLATGSYGSINIAELCVSCHLFG